LRKDSIWRYQDWVC